jgi:hypothetical protein
MLPGNGLRIGAVRIRRKLDFSRPIIATFGTALAGEALENKSQRDRSRSNIQRILGF